MLFQLFNNGKVGKVLHGHLHNHTEYKRKDIDFLNAGGTMFADSHGNHSFHLLDIHRKSIEHSNISISISKQFKKALVNAK